MFECACVRLRGHRAGQRIVPAAPLPLLRWAHEGLVQGLEGWVNLPLKPSASQRLKGGLDHKRLLPF